MPGPGSGVHAPLGVRGIIGTFYRRFEATLGGSWAPVIGTVIQSDQLTETYQLANSAPQLTEWLGSRQSKDVKPSSFTLTNTDYEATLSITRGDWRRDKTGQLMVRVDDLARRAGTHWEALATTLLEGNGTAYDGQDFFDTDHQVADETVYDNELVAGTLPALNVSTPAAPTEDEMVDVIVGMISAAYKAKDSAGEPLNGDAKRWAVMVSPNLAGATLAAIRSSLRKSGSSNAATLQDFELEAIVNPRMTTTTHVLAFRLDTGMRAIILQDEAGPMVEVKGEGSTYAFDKGAYAFGVCATRAAGLGEFTAAMKGILS